MVTFLDITLLESFAPIFSFLLVFLMVYGIFSHFNVLGENKLVHFMVAFVLGVIVLFSKTAIGMISYMAPWFIVFVFFLFFLLLMFMVGGVKQDEIANAIKKGLGLQWTIAIVAIILFFSAFAANVGENVGPYLKKGNETTATGQGDVATTDIGKNVGATIFHPKVLGMLLILLIATASIGLLGSIQKVR